MPETKVFSTEEITAYLARQYEYEAPRVTADINVWLARGDGLAVYENCELGIRDAGATKIVSYGSADAALETDTPPVQLPDTPQSINWRYQLYGVYRGVQLTALEVDMLGIPAARNPRRVSYTCAMDNYEPVPRNTEYGSLVAYDDDSETSGQPRYMRDTSESSIPAQSVFIVDDGKIARPYWGGSVNERNGTELLYPFPVNPEGKTRPDNGRVIDYTAWMLGPRKMYHLKITR